jgi:hypothetical protein
METQLVSPLPGGMRASLAGEWRRAGPAQRFASLIGGAWQGPVSLRKPTTFGISF